MPTNPNPTSAASARGRSERPGKPSLRIRVGNLIASLRFWLDKPVAFASAQINKAPVLGAILRSRIAWVVMIFVIGFAAGVAWQSYGGAGGKAGTSSERLKAMSLALSAARQDLDKLASEMRRLEAQGLDGLPPQRRSAR
jgi:hypothetical protein